MSAKLVLQECPGEVNAHTHLYSALASFGLPHLNSPPVNFLEILERIWWRLDRALDARIVRAAARYHVARALLHGTTTIVDHHESPCFIEGSLDLLADACEELGIRAVLAYGATERNGGPEEASRGLAECERFVRSNGRPLVRGLVGLHASFTVSDPTVRRAGELCRELNVGLHVHAAEDLCDVHDARQRGYAGVVERLTSLSCLPAGSVLAHGVHLSAGQVRTVDANGAWLVQNPRSNQGNGVGYPGALGASSRVALGTDGFDPDMRVELEALRKIGMQAEPAEDGLQGRAAHDHRERLFSGRLAAGRELVEALFRGDSDKENDGATFEVRADGTRRALRVVVSGVPVVEDGELLTGSYAEIHAEAQHEAARLRHRMEAL
jgi:cytosine/adenosine deaminase-related metal-dependent hydrolase